MYVFVCYVCLFDLIKKNYVFYKVKINGEESEGFEVKVGVHQGSVHLV